MESQTYTGKLILVTLPIGNLEDITLRAKKALEEGQIFLAEDTRVLKSLMHHYGIEAQDKRFHSWHDHSEDRALDFYMDLLKKGETVYVTSDAGSPLICDPGHPLVKRAIEENIEVDSFGGISSVHVALELSGLPPYPYHFHGFFPRQNNAIQSLLERCSSVKGVHIYFESPMRIMDTLDAIRDFDPEAQVSIGRELTKKFQSIYRLKACETLEIGGSADDKLKGEMVLLVSYSRELAQKIVSRDMIKEAEEILQHGPKPKVLAKLLGEILGKNTKEIYQELIQKDRS